jgi:Putative Zn-dependent protease, contains TPR repeats
MKTPITFISALLAAGLAWQTAAAAPQSARVRVSESHYTLANLQGDMEAEITFGRDVAARILGQLKLLDAPEVNQYLNLVGNAVALHGNRPEITFRFALVQSDTINAYAAPGGYIFVTTGAFALMQDESELAAVLAHEVAHINQRHIVEALHIRGSDDAPEAGLARLVGGATDTARVAFTQAVDKAVEILFEAGLQQADEFEADRLGLVSATLAGYDPEALPRYLSRLEKIQDAKTAVLYKTHPPLAERQRAIAAMLDNEGLRRLPGASGLSRFNDMKGKLPQ